MQNFTTVKDIVSNINILSKEMNYTLLPAWILTDTVLTHRKIQSSNTSDTGKSTTHTSSSGKTDGGGGRKL